jgi:hypothetical protein
VYYRAPDKLRSGACGTSRRFEMLRGVPRRKSRKPTPKMDDAMVQMFYFDKCIEYIQITSSVLSYSPTSRAYRVKDFLHAKYKTADITGTKCEIRKFEIFCRQTIYLIF